MQTKATLAGAILVATGLMAYIGCGTAYDDFYVPLTDPALADGGTAGSGGTGNCGTCPDDGNPCTEAVCESGACSQMNLPVGTDCGDGNICDATAQCVACIADASTCTGSCTNLCDGQGCGDNAECQNGQCVDGICCDSACDQPCRACNVPGSLGICTSVPNGVADADTCAGTTGCTPTGNERCLCDNPAGDATCVASSGAAVGEGCNQNNACHNNECTTGICRLAMGDPCADPVACGSYLCVDSACQPCAADPDCASGMCVAGTCLAALGEPCDAAGDCVAGTCTTGKLCKLLSGTCTSDIECVANCENGMCDVCGDNSQCDSMMCGGTGGCLFASDAYCLNDAQCASGTCSGFPAKCQ